LGSTWFVGYKNMMSWRK